VGQKVEIEVLTGPQAGGKSQTMREAAITKPGRYL
jgi:DNA mismatch repair ATPase MutS